MGNPPAMATTKISMRKFVILSVLGLVVPYLFAGLALALLLGFAPLVGFVALLIYALITIVLFGISFFQFRKNPDNSMYRSLMVFFAPALLSIIGIIAAYFVLKGRQAL
jgi:hypothetical protein